MTETTLLPLPDDTIGPKLAPCQHSIADIVFVQFLGPHQTSGTLPHSRVFKVKLASRFYVLKVFRFFDLDEIRPYANDARLEHLLPDEHVRHQLDPFFAECRAFGKLKQIGLDSVIAVRCHGYLLLETDIEERITQQFGFSDWNRSKEHGTQPLRAILKDHIRWRTPFHRRKPARVRSELFKLNTEIYIYNMDIKLDNYLGGRLFDFSSSMTAPHILFQPGVRTKHRNRLDVMYDLSCFDSMIKEYTKTWEEKAADKDWSTRLRSRTISDDVDGPW